MEFGFWNIIEILGSLAFFIYGMKLMSDGIQRAAGSALRNILRTMTKNRYLGVFTGFLITALLQSSSATTVMTVSFVNAGLLTLLESAGVMMGANIGTTITGWLISFLGFKVKLAHYSIPLFAIGVPMLFMNKGKTRYWGQFIVGFAILFMGLSYLKGAVPDIKSNPEILDFLKGFTEWGFFSRLFFVFVGTVVTIVVQSSSAAMAITLTMCANGLLPFDVAAAMILGENIGTTITAELASLVGNVNAKRSARIHSMFNIIGVTWMVILMPVFLPMLSNFMQSTFGLADPFTDATAMPLALSGFHTAFNLANVLMLLAFVPWLVKVATWSIKDKEEEDDDAKLKFISDQEITPKTSGRLRGILNICNDLERIGDIYYQISKTIEQKMEDKTYFLPEQRDAINEMIGLVDKAFAEMISNLKTPSYDNVTIDKARAIENEINAYRNKMRDDNLTRLGDADYNVKSAMIYNNIFSSLEKVGDHIINVNESINGQI